MAIFLAIRQVKKRVTTILANRATMKMKMMSRPMSMRKGAKERPENVKGHVDAWCLAWSFSW